MKNNSEFSNSLHDLDPAYTVALVALAALAGAVAGAVWSLL